MAGTLKPRRAKIKESAALAAFVSGLVLLGTLSVPARGLAFDAPMAKLPSTADRTAMAQALQAMAQDRWTAARSRLATLKHPLAARLYDWMYLRDQGTAATFDAVRAFVDANPGWPGQKDLLAKAEKAIQETQPDADIIGWFGRFPPQSARAMDIYLQALVRQERTQDMKTALRGWWASAALGADEQKDMLGKYGMFLDMAAHAGRIDRQLLAQRYTNARALARRVGKGWPELVEARIALAQDTGGVNALIARVPKQLQGDPGLAYERLRWRRRHNMDFEAMEILHRQPAAGQVSNLPDWWTERQIIARRLMDRGQYKSAYLLAAGHKQTDGVPFADAEWLAGWLALKKLNDPSKAFTHFEAMYHRVESPISRSRGAYWAGLASKGLGYPEIADQWFTAAARHPETFYGQMALAALSPGAPRPVQTTAPQPGIDRQQAFNRLEMAQAARALHAAGLRREASAFIGALEDQAKAPEDYRLVADLAVDIGHYHDGVRVAKDAARKGVILPDQAYPTMLARMKGVDAEWALVHALIRQESMFDEQARSAVGALGLMQLMPSTAAEVARKEGIRHNAAWLTSRPEYNIRLGSSYLEQMVDRFDGSYVLALAAYNAGPGRVRQWIAERGDPRDPKVDMADWVEEIPFSETRNYVQRVLESVYVYRLKFKDIQRTASAPLHVAMND